MRRIGLLVLTALVIAGCGSGSNGSVAKPPPQEVAGSVNVHDAGMWVKGCKAFFRSGNDDITTGTSVTIKNAAGTTVGVAQLGSVAKQGTNFENGICGYTFEASVPPSNFYSIAVGSHSPTTVPRAKADAVVIDFQAN